MLRENRWPAEPSMFEGRGVLLARMLSHSENHCTFSVVANDRLGVPQIVLQVSDYEHR